jgi:plastocyanin domain-containing protein
MRLLPLILLAGCASTADVIRSPELEAAAPAVAAAPSGVVELTVTDAGFQPEHVAVQKGQPVTLVVTRKTEATCARDIVLPDHGIRRALPLGEPVELTFTPEKSGELRYGCAMDQMVGGVLLVE